MTVEMFATWVAVSLATGLLLSAVMTAGARGYADLVVVVVQSSQKWRADGGVTPVVVA